MLWFKFIPGIIYIYGNNHWQLLILHSKAFSWPFSLTIFLITAVNFAFTEAKSFRDFFVIFRDLRFRDKKFLKIPKIHKWFTVIIYPSDFTHLSCWILNISTTLCFSLEVALCRQIVINLLNRLAPGSKAVKLCLFEIVNCSHCLTFSVAFLRLWDCRGIRQCLYLRHNLLPIHLQAPKLELFDCLLNWSAVNGISQNPFMDKCDMTQVLLFQLTEQLISLWVTQSVSVYTKISTTKNLIKKRIKKIWVKKSWATSGRLFG